MTGSGREPGGWREAGVSPTSQATISKAQSQVLRLEEATSLDPDGLSPCPRGRVRCVGQLDKGA